MHLKEVTVFETSMLPVPRRRGIMSLGYVIEGILLGLLVLFPLIHGEALPSAMVSAMYIQTPPPPATPLRRSAPRTVSRATLRDLLAAAVTIPNRIVQSSRQPPAAIEAPVVGIPGSVPWGDAHGLPEALGAAIPPPPAPSEPSVRRLHVGGAVEAAKLVFQPRPEYPQIARMARVQGTVRLAAVITGDGVIGDLEVLSGPPLLVKAALDAVSRWRYQPTLLNGEPVEVSTEIDLNFVLGE